MLRQRRLDAPGALHHVMGRGIEKVKIFRGDPDREDFLARLAGLCREGNLGVYAWSLMPNHFHLLVRTGQETISKSMKKLLTNEGDVVENMNFTFIDDFDKRDPCLDKPDWMRRGLCIMS